MIKSHAARPVTKRSLLADLSQDLLFQVICVGVTEERCSALSLLPRVYRLSSLSLWIFKELGLFLASRVLLSTTTVSLLLKLILQLLLQMLLNLILRHERQIMKGTGRHSHLLELLLSVSLYWERKRYHLSRDTPLRMQKLKRLRGHTIRHHVGSVLLILELLLFLQSSIVLYWHLLGLGTLRGLLRLKRLVIYDSIVAMEPSSRLAPMMRVVPIKVKWLIVADLVNHRRGLLWMMQGLHTRRNHLKLEIVADLISCR